MDTPTGNLFLFLGFLLLLGSLPTIFILTRSRQRGSAWQKLAAQLDLTFDASGREPRISGTYQGRAVTIEPVIGGTGRFATVNTRVQAAITSGSLPKMQIIKVPLEMTPKQRDQARALKGYQDIVDIGDPGFDKYYLVQTDAAAQAQAILGGGSQFQHAVKSMLARPGLLNIKTGEGMLAVEATGYQTNPAQLHKTLDDTCAAAEALEAAR